MKSDMTLDATDHAAQLTLGNTLPAHLPRILLGGCALFVFCGFLLWVVVTGENFQTVPAVLVSILLYTIMITGLSRYFEGRRQALNRFMTTAVTVAFALAILPLLSLGIEVVSRGIARFDAEFFTSSMRNITGEGGGIVHAVVGTLLITLAATLISVPVGLLTAIYLVEYGRGKIARTIVFFVDVMTGIPSIVAGLFAYALFAIFFGSGVRMGIVGAVALSVLMIPVVVRSSEEMIRLVPAELREASYALGIPKWRTILRVVLPTSIAGISTGVVLAIARVIGETAPLLITAGFTASVNYNLFSGRMQSLPVFVYTQYTNQGNPVHAFLDRAWSAALVLILIVMAFTLLARVIVRLFSAQQKQAR